MLMAPDIERIVFPTPELYLNGIRQIISLIIKMDRPIAVIDLFPITQVYHAEVIRVLLWVIVKAKPEAQNIIETLLKSSARPECFLILANNRVFALKP